MNDSLINGVRGIQNILSSSCKFGNEQATKQGLVLPLLQALGYNVFNVEEVIPEAVADIGIKKGEKVDYKIRLNEKDAMIIECKTRDSQLTLSEINQLYRYYSCVDVSIAVLTNGNDYWFFTDSDKKNIMDTEPYEKIQISSLKSNDDIELAFDKYSKTKITSLNVKNSLSSFKFNKECERVVDSILIGDIPTYIIEAIAKQLGLGTSYTELKALKDKSNLKNLLVNKYNNLNHIQNDAVKNVIKNEEIKQNDVISPFEIKLNTEYTYEMLLGKTLDYHKLDYYIIGDVRYNGGAMVQVYFNLIDYALSKNINALDVMLKQSHRFQLYDTFSPVSDVKAWTRRYKVVKNLMVYHRFSANAIVKQLGYVINAANLPNDTVKMSFRE